jgi:hypothetical protein
VVSIPAKSAEAITDRNGYFELEIRQDNAPDLILFSCMGYERDSLLINQDRSEGIEIVLKTKIYDIEPVNIPQIEYTREIEGNDRDHEAGSLYIDTHGQQTALFVKNRKGKTGRIITVDYYLSEEGNTDAPFRVRIYDVDSSGKPGKDLIKDAVIVKPALDKGWYSIDVSALKIDFPETGAFIALEGVFPDDIEDYYGDSEFIDLSKQDEKDPSQMLTYGQRIGYNRKCRQDTWHYSMSKVWFQLEKQSFGVMISAVVRYENEIENDKNERNESGEN